MLMETFALWLILCLALALIAFKIHNFPVATVSSLGLIITGMKYYLDDPDIFVLGMLWAIALILPVAVGKSKER